ncbi:WD repeat-containing protein 78, partial [Intoshia linei]
KKEDNVNNNILYDHEMQTFNNVDKYKGVQTQDVKKEDGKENMKCKTFIKKLMHKQNYATLCDLQESDHLLSADNTLMEIMSSSKDTKIKSASSKSAISTASTEIENVENNYINILEISEKIIAINNYKVNLAKYQDIKPPSTAGISGIFDIDYSDQDEMFHLEELWRLESDETNKNVTSINLNPKNEFILAITHGNYDKFRTEDYGLVSCWSLKNIEHPKRMHQFSTGVISCDFSKKNPNILAIGLHDGRIILFDVTLDENPVVLDNMNNPDKNIGIIWKLCWVIIEEKNDVIKLENLYSASQDGRITYWDKEKRFEANDIMLMKRAPIRKTNQKLTNSEIGKSELENQFLTGYTGAISMDFNKDNNKLYLVGTEDGSVQLCSISHNEQYLQTYYYHTAPINKIVWSPFNSDIFITASSDWTICIWSKHNDEPIVCLHGTKPVLDVIWSPSTSTLIASITSETLNIWDMTENLLDPITTNNAPPNSKYTCIKFNHDGKSIYVGTSVGVVYLYSLVGLSDKSLNNNSKQLKAILESKKIN